MTELAEYLERHIVRRIQADIHVSLGNGGIGTWADATVITRLEARPGIPVCVTYQGGHDVYIKGETAELLRSHRDIREWCFCCDHGSACCDVSGILGPAAERCCQGHYNPDAGERFQM